MKTLEALQREIDTSTDLQSIVRTMKTLAAVSIRQYERAQQSLNQYHKSIEMGLEVMLQQYPYLPEQAHHNKVAAIIFGSDHGLCGRYNENIVKFSLAQISPRETPCRILVIGTRVESALTELGLDVEDFFWVPGTVESITQTIQKILLKIDCWQQQGITQILLFHHTCQQNKSYTPQKNTLLPVDLSHYGRKPANPWPSNSLPQYSMAKEPLLSALIRQQLFIKLFRACAESLAGEHASRLLSMQVAEKNIKERLETLTSDYRQQRQNQITEELLDVVSGFEVLQDGS